MKGTMTKMYVENALLQESRMKEGDIIIFGYDWPEAKWRFALVKEGSQYAPYCYALTGRKLGTHETWARRYMSMSDAFLHVANHLNENTEKKNQFSNLDEWLRKCS